MAQSPTHPKCTGGCGRSVPKKGMKCAGCRKHPSRASGRRSGNGHGFGAAAVLARSAVTAPRGVTGVSERPAFYAAQVFTRLCRFTRTNPVTIHDRRYVEIFVACSDAADRLNRLFGSA